MKKVSNKKKPSGKTPRQRPYIIQGQGQQPFQQQGGGFIAPPIIQPPQIALNAPYPLIPPPNVLNRNPNIIYVQRPKEKHHMRYRWILVLILLALITGVIIYATIGTNNNNNNSANNSKGGGTNPVTRSGTRSHTNPHTLPTTREVTNPSTINPEIIAINKQAIQGTMLAIGLLLGLYVIGIFGYYVGSPFRGISSRKGKTPQELAEEEEGQWRHLHKNEIKDIYTFYLLL